MAALTCNANTLMGLAAPLQSFSRKELLATIAYYLYRQKNTGSATANVDWKAQLASAECISCKAGFDADERTLLMFMAYIARQTAIDAGWAGDGTFNAAAMKSLRSKINEATNLSESQIRAITLCLRAALA